MERRKKGMLMGPMAWVIVAVIAVLVGLRVKTAYRSPVQLRELRRALDAGAVLVDVRSSSEFAAHHVDGALNVPVQDIVASRLDRLPSRNETLVLYCASGSRSAVAKRSLLRAGFERVYDLGPIANFAKLRALHEH